MGQSVYFRSGPLQSTQSDTHAHAGVTGGCSEHSTERQEPPRLRWGSSSASDLDGNRAAPTLDERGVGQPGPSDPGAQRRGSGLLPPVILRDGTF